MSENTKVLDKKGSKKTFLFLFIFVLACCFYLLSQYSEINVHVIRHGVLQPSKRFSENSALLSPYGVQQATELGDLLKGRKIEVIYSSPVEHDRTMASVIAAKVGAAMEVDERINAGGDYHQLVSIITEKKEESKATLDDKNGDVSDGGRSIEKAKLKIMEFVNARAKFGSSGLYVVVPDEVLKTLYTYAHAYVSPSTVEPASISTFAYDVFSGKFKFKECKSLKSMQEEVVANSSSKASPTSSDNSRDGDNKERTNGGNSDNVSNNVVASEKNKATASATTADDSGNTNSTNSNTKSGSTVTHKEEVGVTTGDDVTRAAAAQVEKSNDGSKVDSNTPLVGDKVKKNGNTAADDRISPVATATGDSSKSGGDDTKQQ